MNFDDRSQITVYRLPSTYNQSQRLNKKQKNELKLRKEFKRAASMLANKLARDGKGRKAAKNKELASHLRKLIEGLDYEVFSRCDPKESDKAFNSKNLVFRIVDPGAMTDNNNQVSSHEVAIDKPIEKISLLRNRHGESYIPLTDSVRITLPLDGHHLSEIGGGGKKIATAYHQGRRDLIRRKGIKRHQVSQIHEVERRVDIWEASGRGTQTAHPNRMPRGRRFFMQIRRCAS